MNVKSFSGTVVAANKAAMQIEVLSVNLLSVNKIVSKGDTMMFDNAGCKVMNSTDDLVATECHKNGLFKREYMATQNSKTVGRMIQLRSSGVERSRICRAFGSLEQK